MQRHCKHCGRRLSVRDLAKDKTVSMETDRKTKGLTGFHFRCYTCPECGYDDLFVEALHIAGEDPAEFRRRREKLEEAAREVRVSKVEVAVVERPPANLETV